MRSLAAAAVLAGALGGCAMPMAGPSAQTILTQVDNPALPFIVIDVDPSVLRFQQPRWQNSLASVFGTGTARADLRIRSGDVVSVSLWEAPPGTLFTSTVLTGNQSLNASSSVTVPLQSVGEDGTLGIPYAGRIPVVGDTAAEVENKIVAALARKAVQPQALVAVQKSSQNAVSVTGEVAGGARIPLSAGGERVLDAIAAAGGLRGSVNESVVQIARGRRTASALFDTVVNNPKENIFLQPGDVLTVTRQPRTFVAFGATGRNAEIPFDAPQISVAEALGKAGGLLDYRADAGGVFLFRLEQPALVRRLMPHEAHLIPREGAVPVIYRFNLLDPKTMLAMTKFWVEPKDVIYVSNADGAELQKFMNILQGVASPALNAAAIGVAAR